MRKLLVVDAETTGLSPVRGEIWDLAVIEYGPGSERRESQWFLKPDLAKADPAALAVGRYYERTEGLVRVREHAPAEPGGRWWCSAPHVAAAVARLLDGATLAGAVPSFDAGFLAAFLLAHGEAPTWHYRLRDIGSMAYGYLMGRAQGAQFLAEPGSDAGREHPGMPSAVPPLDASTDDFARALGVDPDRFERHSALGDCLLVAACLDVITGSAA